MIKLKSTFINVQIPNGSGSYVKLTRKRPMDIANSFAWKLASTQTKIQIEAHIQTMNSTLYETPEEANEASEAVKHLKHYLAQCIEQGF